MSFKRQIMEDIEKLESLDHVRTRINKLNDLILKALKNRSQYPVCKDYFENTPQRELESKGIDTIWWKPVYSHIIEKICVERKLSEEEIKDVVEAESELEKLVYERIWIGKKAVDYKDQKNGKITDNEREDEIIKDVREKAPGYSLDPNAVEEIFRFLIKKNKHVQEAYDRSYPDANHGLKKPSAGNINW